jgi:hypothetical protein
MRVKPVAGLVCLAVSLLAILSGNSHAGFPYVGLYGDTVGGWGGENHGLCAVFVPTPYTTVEMWVWFLPDPVKGMSGAEFRILYSLWSYMIPGAIMSNPLNESEIGDPASGVVVSLGENCQSDWYWTHRQELLIKTMRYSKVAVIGNPANGGHKYVTSCEPGRPSYDATLINQLTVNGPGCEIECGVPMPMLWIANVEPKTYTRLRVYFNDAVCCSLPSESHFVMYKKDSPSDTIQVVLATQDTNLSFILDLESPLEDSTTYVIETKDIRDCECDLLSDDYKSKFTFDESVGTLLQSSSAALVGSGIEVAWELSEVDRGVEFFVSRSENGGDFTPLDGTALERDGLKFTYVDRSVEPGRKYSYKVEYGIGAPSRLLFISEAISTPAMPLTLYQNQPNPFNPSTTISFYLPEETSVRLEIYDLAGRLVDRLIGGERRDAGSYREAWDGRDARGNPVSSGIYFYRLRAGKEMISKKMVLLR